MPCLYKTKEGLLLAEKDSILYVLEVESGRVHSFNSSAKSIFEICMRPSSVDSITEEYVSYFNISIHIAREDVLLLLDKLVRIGLLEELTNSER
ncbi:MAG: PqqD family peptide modification chaperone [Candidatus Theseobacter exili]|nr:PqqD family peptide modification chaperone [Candidatus Theseobacter exili]